MKRLILAAGGLLLATANTPPAPTSDMAKPEGELSSVVAAPAPEAPHATHGPVAAPAAPMPHHIAAAPEYDNSYPRCSSTIHDRCDQRRSGHAGAPHAHRIQLAMRAGERG
jgi:hypothetical protein